MLVHYVATSYGDKESVGSATYNVSPPEIGGFFNKLQCFCFTEQRLAAGERLDDAGGVLHRPRPR